MVAVGVPFALLLIIVSGLGLILKGPVRSEVQRLVRQTSSPGFRQRLADWKPLDFPVGQQIVENDARILSVIPQLEKGINVAARDIANMFIVPVLSFFILKDARRLRNRLIERAPIRPQAFERILDDAHTLMLRYMRGLLILCLTTLICFGVGLGVMRVRYTWIMHTIGAPGAGPS